MSKVLAVPASDIPATAGFTMDIEGMQGPFIQLALEADFQFVDREQAEKDPSFKQIIPYVIAVHSPNPGVLPKLLAYTRSKAGSEGRLHSKLSIGIGGHVEEQDGIEPSLMSIPRCVVREIKEEVGVDITPENFPEIAGLIYDPSDEVGQCHLGIVFIWRVPDGSHILTENTIENAQWLTIDELIERMDEMESWSRLLVKAIVCGRNGCRGNRQEPCTCN